MKQACVAGLIAPAPLGVTLPDSAGRNTFGNSLADSVSFRFPSRQSLGGYPTPPATCAPSPCHTGMSETAMEPLEERV